MQRSESGSNSNSFQDLQFNLYFHSSFSLSFQNPDLEPVSELDSIFVFSERRRKENSEQYLHEHKRQEMKLTESSSKVLRKN